VTRKPKKSFFKRGSAGAQLKIGDGIASEKAASVNHRHAVSEKLDFGESVRSEKQCSLPMVQDFRFKEAAKLRGGDSIEAARGLVEQQDVGLMEKGASQAETLDRAGGECAHLAVKCYAQMKLFGKLPDSLRCG
jgi:hypothetical protein